MRGSLLPVLLLPLLAAGPAAAQTFYLQPVYKCETANGVVFSGQPCGKDAQRVEVPPPHIPSPDSIRRRKAAEAYVDASMRDSELDRWQDKCVDNRTAYTWRTTRETVTELQAELARLRQRRSGVALTTLGYIHVDQIDTNINVVKSRMARQKQNWVRTFDEAQRSCARERARIEAADARRRQQGSR